MMNSDLAVTDIHAPHKNDCRLCGGPLLRLFHLTVLSRYDVEYFQCTQCGSAQTEDPYWLEDAYRNHLAKTDTGAAQRCIHNMAACYFTAKLFRLKKIVDIGGSDGLLCRLLRDYSLDAYVLDKYAQPTYAQGFSKPYFTKPDMVTAFEVLEHLGDPKTDLDMLFGYNPPLLLTTTLIYSGQNSGWWYFAPHSGQHVFFYSRKALEWIASRYKYRLIISGGYILFAKATQLPVWKRFVASILLNKVVCRLLCAVMVLLPTPGTQHDSDALVAEVHMQSQKGTES